MVPSVFRRTDGNDLPGQAEDSAAFDDAEFFEVGTAARTGFGGRGPEREKLTDVGQKHWRLDFQISFSG